MRHGGASDGGTLLYSNGTHVSVICVVAVGMMQADIDTEIDPVILRVPPASIDDLICVGGGVDGAIRDAIIDAIVTIVIDPITKAV